MLSLTLYVAGNNAFSRRACINLDSIVAEMAVNTSVVIIDVLTSPELTLAKRIFVTPSLVIQYNGGAEILIVGDLTDRQKIATSIRSAQSTLPGR